MYSKGQGQRLIMLVRPMTIDGDTRMSERSYGDITGVTWASKGTGFSLVGPAPAFLLHPIADEVRRQQAKPI
jgi:anti-sigma factor RsiW